MSKPSRIQPMWQTVWQSVWKWGRGCAVFILMLGAILAWVVGGRLVAPANRVVGPFPQDLLQTDVPVKETTIASESGSQLATWYVPCENAKATIVLLHPIRADRRSMLGRAKLLYETGYAVVLIDLQAHGESPGEAITVGFRERHDVIAAVQFAREQNPDHRIGVVGRSLGGAAALLGSPLQIDALVLESVYPTITEAVRNRVAIRMGPLTHVVTPALLVQFRPRLGFSATELRPIDTISGVGCPVLVASGDRDVHTSMGETRRMFESASQPKELAIFEGAAHEDLLMYDPKQYREQIVSFLDRYLGL